jgi:ABC-2 type transport system ATP-binding protein
MKSYGHVAVLAGVDLQVAPASVHALLGPNGAGKTTLVRIFCTLATADAGQARVAGFDVARQRSQVRRRISLTGQYAAVDGMQTGEENLTMMGRLLGLTRRAARARAAQMLEQFDLVESGERRVGTYSGGMRRRLDLAVSLVGQPSIIFLDEPTTGLDLPSRQTMWRVIDDLASAGVTVLLTTQYLEDADQLADRVAVLDHGRIIADGTVADLKRQVAEQRLDVTTVDDATYRRFVSDLGERAIHRDASRRVLGIAIDGSAAHIRALLDHLDPQRTAISTFAVHSATLDDVFLALTGHTTDSPMPIHPAPGAAGRTDMEIARV